MTFSMTGYGKQTAIFKGRVLTVEIRTLNSKQTDINLKIPNAYREKEFDLREKIADSLGRGKIDLVVQRDLAADAPVSAINEETVVHHYKTIKQLEQRIGEPPAKSAIDYLRLAMKMPDVMQSVSEEVEAGEYDELFRALDGCIAACMEFRQQEGAKLEKVLCESNALILQGLEAIAPLEAERIGRIRGRITGHLGEETTESLNFDRDRFEQELIYYLEKIDITEEKVRLKAHCDYFIRTIEEEQLKGKKLSFIAQEMGREINTLGSKAQHHGIQKIVVGMKDELEKIKEQVLNVL